MTVAGRRERAAAAAGGRPLVSADLATVAWLTGLATDIESGPEEYWYTPGYYAVFFYDPDGIKLEIVHLPGLAA